MISYQNKLTDMLNYLSPYDLDFNVCDIDFSKMNPRMTQKRPSVFVFDKEKVDINFLQSSETLPSRIVNCVDISIEVDKFLISELQSKCIPYPIGQSKIQSTSSCQIRIIPKPSKNWVHNFDSISEECNTFKAISMYLMEHLFKTSAVGFFVAYSGGSDSTLTAVFVYFMCQALTYFTYQKINHEIIFKISFGLKEIITLRKVSLTTEEQKSCFYFTGEQLLLGGHVYCLADSISEIDSTATYQYFLGENISLTLDNVVKKILNVAYLPMVFSGKTKQFVNDFRVNLNCNFVEFSIQSSFDALKLEAEKTLEK